jgi:hypoxia up-regulated 1
MLLGREYGDPLVEARRGTRLLYDLRKDDERNTYAVNVAPNITLSPEELTGMILRYAKALAKESVQEDVRDCAITVPPYFTVRQRQALLDAARLAGFAPLGLINEGTAAATHYLSKLPLEKLPRYVMLYDMGAMDTSATLFEVKHVNETRGKFSKKSITVGVLETLAVAYDASLGGSDFDEALATHFKRAIATQRPDIDVHANGGRAWSRLVKEAQRVKEVLSANVEFTARVEGVVEGYDFKLPITRAEFEQLSEPLLARVAVPAVDALARAGIDAKQLDLFELVGGGWRVPAVQKRLQVMSCCVS